LASMALLKNARPVGVLNLLRAFSPANQRCCGDTPNKFGTPALPSGDPSHDPMLFNKVFDTSLRSYSASASLFTQKSAERLNHRGIVECLLQ
jgi:hypothetical protein